MAKLLRDRMSANISRKKLASLLSLITLISLLAAGFAMYFTNSLGYVPWASLTFFTVYLISHVIASGEYISYFRKHCQIYKIILATGLVFLIIAVVVRPAYYLVSILIGVFTFDFILALLMLIIHDQNKVKTIQSNLGNT
jgi:hypothetical protein